MARFGATAQLQDAKSRSVGSPAALAGQSAAADPSLPCSCSMSFAVLHYSLLRFLLDALLTRRH